MSKTAFTILPNEPKVIITRMFDAPAAKVYAAYTDPQVIPQWWGPSDLTTVIDAFDFRVGGTWRFVQKDKEGNEYAFNGEYTEIIPNERISDTFHFEPWQDAGMVETADFEEVEGKTKLTITCVFKDIQGRDHMVESGMESGLVEGHNRLDEILASA